VFEVLVLTDPADVVLGADIYEKLLKRSSILEHDRGEHWARTIEAIGKEIEKSPDSWTRNQFKNALERLYR
jgi:hypothetical protein